MQRKMCMVALCEFSQLKGIEGLVTELMGIKSKAKNIGAWYQWAICFKVEIYEVQEAERTLDLDDLTNIKKCRQNIEAFSMDHPPTSKNKRLSLDDEEDFVPGSEIEDLIDIGNKNLIVNGWTLDSCRWWD